MEFSTRLKALALAACLSFTSIGLGQAVYGSIFGTVTDATGAVVPDANVTVTDPAKGTSVSVTTNASGEFTVEHLIPDTYTVKIVATGFKGFEQPGIVLNADTSKKVEASLTPGGTSETVEVRADAVPQLKTDRADVATIFSSAEIEDLPVGDRNFTNLQLLLPGAQKLGWNHAADENPQGSQQIQVDGQAFGGTAFELDGTDNQDPILGIIVINPNIDSLTESKITTQNFDAEFGKAVSSVVTAQTKSGSNTFHGSAFDYRESAANLAKDPFSQGPGRAGIPAALKNQFGGSIGGKIITDRLFFFGDYQGVRQKVGTSVIQTVPSAHLTATCLGQAVAADGTPGCDFGEYLAALGPVNGVIYQQNGTPYPDNVIPAAQLSTPALNLLTILQAFPPNNSGSISGLKNNRAASGTGLFNSNQWDERIDYTLSSRIHVFERFSRFTDILSGQVMFGAAGGAGFGIGNYGGNSKGANDSTAAGADIAINQGLVTDVRAGYYRYNVIDSKYDAGVNFADQLGIPGLNTGTAFTSGAPGFNITEVGSFGGPGNGQSQGPQYGSGLNITRCNCPLEEREDQFQLANNWTKTLGNHLVKVGVDLRYARNLRVASDNDRTGLLQFGTGPTSNGSSGGLGFATFLLGDVTSFNRYVSTSNNAKEFQKRFFFYGQDTWRVTPKLTVNYGLRYEYYSPERVNGVGNGSLMDLKTGYLHVAGIGKVPLNMGWEAANNAYNPRIGVAYQIKPTTVIRAGYGRSFDLGVFGSIFGHVVTQNLPVLVNQQITNSGGTTSAFTLSTGPAAPVPFSVPSNGLLPNPGSQVNSKARPNPLRLPTLDAWNLAIQQSITPTLSLTVAYVGNKGTHTLSAGDGNNTNPNEDAIFLPAQFSITGQPLHYDGSVADGVIAADGGTRTTNFLRRYFGGTLPACQDPVYVTPSNVLPGQCGWTNDISYYGDDQDTHYNALQATLTKQFTHGVSFNGNYAWQRAVNFGNGFATWDKRANKGRDDSIREQQIIVYGLAALPFGRNKMFFSNANNVVNEIIGGWQISPVLNYSSGLPFSLGYSECGRFLPGDAPCFVNGNPGALQKHITGFPGNGLKFYDAVTDDLTVHPRDGFTANTLDVIGNSGRNSRFGPHFFNTDLALQKDFPIKESLFAQFRVDAYNAFNHINFGNPGGNIEQDGNIGNGPGVSGSSNPRQLQFSLRLQF